MTNESLENIGGLDCRDIIDRIDFNGGAVLALVVGDLVENCGKAIDDKAGAFFLVPGLFDVLWPLLANEEFSVLKAFISVF